MLCLFPLPLVARAECKYVALLRRLFQAELYLQPAFGGPAQIRRRAEASLSLESSSVDYSEVRRAVPDCRSASMANER